MTLLSTVIQRGTLAARPAATAVPVGTLYGVTDSGVEAIYRSTGAAWELMGTSTAGAGDNAIPKTIVDAKGDIIAGTAADTVARLAVGTNDQALIADSAQSTGLKYAGVVLQTLADARGDIIAASAADTWARKALGASGTFLRSDGTDPQWEALVADDIPATFGEVPWAATTDASVTNTTTPTNLLTANTGTKQIPAAFWAVGRSFRLTLKGYYEVDVSSPAGSAAITLVLGATTLATAFFTFPADTATVADYFEIEAVSTCRVTGASGSLMSQIRGGIHFPGVDQPLWAVPAQPMTAVTINISGANNVVLNWAWDVADPDNTVTCTNAMLELL